MISKILSVSIVFWDIVGRTRFAHKENSTQHLYKNNPLENAHLIAGIPAPLKNMSSSVQVLKSPVCNICKTSSNVPNI